MWTPFPVIKYGIHGILVGFHGWFMGYKWDLEHSSNLDDHNINHYLII